ncbi:MAG: hypothetical protein GYB24_01525 [Rhodobacteraceae bacterium]|nr:hypothetical protein [Paracoccaceae bacterium]
MLTSEIVERHVKNPHFPSVSTRLANFLRIIGDSVGEPGVKLSIGRVKTQFQVGCKSVGGLIGLFNHLQEQGYISKESKLASNSSMIVLLTVAGWIEYEHILKDNTIGRKAFIAMPFDKPDLDDVWLPGLREAVRETGYVLERVDDNPKSGLIDTRMQLQIKAARFLLVELTHSNLGAYWEAGMAEGLGKPVIYLRRNDDLHKAHFDVEHAFRVSWDANNVQAAYETIKATIRNTMPDAKMSDDLVDGIES